MRRTIYHGVARHVVLLTMIGALIAGAASTASATVRFGNTVFIGGHDFSNQTFDRNHRAVIHLSDTPPRHAGCVSHNDGRGGWVKICHLRRIRRVVR